MLRLPAMICLLCALAFSAFSASLAQTPTPSAQLDDAAAEADSQTGDSNTIRFWLGAYANYAESGIPYGCDGFLLPVDTGTERSGDTVHDLRAALEALLSPDHNHPQAETEDWLKTLGLGVAGISISEGFADVALDGALMGIGGCGDALMEGQILRTVFQFEEIERVRVSDGLTNLWEITDLTDWHSREYRKNYVYARPDAEKKLIQFWVGAYEDYGAQGIPYGCDSFLLPVDTDVTQSGHWHTDLRLALEALFDPALNHPEADTEDWLKGLGLSVEEIRLASGMATVSLGGDLIGIGSCGDAIVEGQILNTIFQFDAIESVKVMAGGRNLRAIVDMSDSLTDEELREYTYSRPGD